MSQQLVTDLLHKLGFTEFEIRHEEAADHQVVHITLPSEESGLLIGVRGEKVDALQTLLNLMLNPKEGDFRPVQVNVNDYREMREKSLQQLADKAAQQATSEGQEVILPSLPSHERRIVHLYLEKNSSVTTYSEGQGRNRRLIVRPLDEE